MVVHQDQDMRVDLEVILPISWLLPILAMVDLLREEVGTECHTCKCNITGADTLLDTLNFQWVGRLMVGLECLNILWEQEGRIRDITHKNLQGTPLSTFNNRHTTLPLLAMPVAISHLNKNSRNEV